MQLHARRLVFRPVSYKLKHAAQKFLRYYRDPFYQSLNKKRRYSITQKYYSDFLFRLLYNLDKNHRCKNIKPKQSQT